MLSTVAVSLVLGGLTVGCSSDDGAMSSTDLQDALAKAGSGGAGSTVAPVDDANPAPITGASPNEIRIRFGAAIADQDFCAFLAELDNVVTDLTDPAAVVAAYEQLRDSVRAAVPMAPAELTDQWTVLVGATERAAASVERSDGDPTDKSLEGVFVDPEVDAAIDSIFAYEDRQCRAPATSSTTSSTTTTTSTTPAPTALPAASASAAGG